MNTRLSLALWVSFSILAPLFAADPPRFTGLQLLGNREVDLTLGASSGARHRIDTSANAEFWEPLVTLPSNPGSQTHTDTGAPFASRRYYRAVEVPAGALTGDHLPTSDGDVLIHPIEHATLLLVWKGVAIYADPGRGTGPFTGLPPADVILLSHEHSDHYDSTAVNSLLQPSTRLVAGQYVYDNSLTTALRAQTTVLANGQSFQHLGVGIQAVAMYNLPPGTIYHPQGRGNGYVLTLGGKRLYISGDSEDTPEMRALPNIDVAFLAMNQPFTMTPDQAASATRQFQPRIVYPYHYSSTDLNLFRQLVGTDLPIEIRLRNWYP